MATRSTTIDLFAPKDRLRQIVTSIRHYRATLRQIYSALTMAQMAGAKIAVETDDIRVSPNRDAAQLILANAFGHDGKALGYQMRQWVLNEAAPSWYSHTWDSLRRDLEIAWKAQDPKLNASRGWLTLQGARDVGQFNRRGIGIPAIRVKGLRQHLLVLAWDKQVGTVEFRVPRLNGGRYIVWKSLRDKEEGWKLGTVYLNEHNGRICATISYTRPDNVQDTDPKRVLSVAFDADATDAFVKLRGPDSRERDTLSAVEAIAWLQQLRARRTAIEQRKAATGNPRRRWGSARLYRQTQELLSRVTRQRTNGVSHRNHLWTRRVISRAIAWRCGTIDVMPLPGNLCGQEWPWSQWQQYIDYKAKETGITVNIRKETTKT